MNQMSGLELYRGTYTLLQWENLAAQSPRCSTSRNPELTYCARRFRLMERSAHVTDRY